MKKSVRKSYNTEGNTRATRFECRDIGANGEIEGYISVFGQEDSYRTKFVKGCFQRSIEERGGRPLKMLFNHDKDMIIGKWTELREDDHGLFGRGYITDKNSHGRDARGLVEEGILDGLSHAFRSRNYDKNTREFKDVVLVEASLVSFESCPGASLRNDYSANELIEILSRDTGLPREQVLGILSGEKRASVPTQSLANQLAAEISGAFTL